MEKKEVRKLIRELKKQYSSEQKKEMSELVWCLVEEDVHFRQAKVVLGYWSMDDEVFTHDFLNRWSKEKTILLPCVKGDELEIRYFEGAGKLCPGEAFGIGEPVGELCTDLDQIDVILVPGVAFDGQCNRLGRGRGYYDRILKNTRGYKIGICFDFQYLTSVPTDDYDVKMDRVIK